MLTPPESIVSAEVRVKVSVLPVELRITEVGETVFAPEPSAAKTTPLDARINKQQTDIRIFEQPEIKRKKLFWKFALFNPLFEGNESSELATYLI
jgi:hypothetical protein